jgi:hypothetical protein
MNRASDANKAESEILTRMAASRAALLVANHTAPASVPVSRGRSRPPAASLMTSLADAPRVTLLLALCIGAIALGPHRTLRIVGRAGITAWLAGTARKVIAQAV